MKLKTPFSRMFCILYSVFISLPIISCIQPSEEDLCCSFPTNLTKCVAVTTVIMVGCAFLIIQQGFVSHQSFCRILKVILKMLQLFYLPDCNGEGDKIDSSLWHRVSMLLSSTCWLTAVQDYYRFISHEQDNNNSK